MRHTKSLSMEMVLNLVVKNGFYVTLEFDFQLVVPMRSMFLLETSLHCGPNLWHFFNSYFEFGFPSFELVLTCKVSKLLFTEISKFLIAVCLNKKSGLLLTKNM